MKCKYLLQWISCSLLVLQLLIAGKPVRVLAAGQGNTADTSSWCCMHEKVNNPAVSNGASSPQRCEQRDIGSSRQLSNVCKQSLGSLFAGIKIPETEKTPTIKITVSAAGDCTLGIDSRYNNSFNSYYNQKGAGYFLKKVKKIFKEDDITLANFEGTLTKSCNRANKTFTFKGPENYTQILKKGSVEVVNLANNHTMDFGKTGFADTKRALKKGGIAYCHYGTIAYKKVKGIRVAFLGFSQLSGVSREQIKDTIKTAKKKRAKIIIVSFHWGIERDYYPNGIQKSLGKYAIDQGAALVIGHHPHVLQGIETYKGRYIVYSLGNFCFGGNTNPADKDTMIFQQTFYLKNGKLLKRKDARVIPCSLSSVSYTNNYQPVPLSGNAKRRLIKKMNRLSKGMHTTVQSNGKIK